MYSNLVKADYEIKDIKLQELRDRIVSENNLTPLDILKGFHEKSKARITYKTVLTEENVKDIKDIEKEYEQYLIDNSNDIQKLYDEEFNRLFDNCKKECPEVSLEDIINYNKDDKINISVSAKNACFRFLLALKNEDRPIKKKFEKAAKAHVEQYIKETFGDNYSVSTTGDMFNKFEGLPYSLDFNKLPEIDFKNVFELYNNYTGGHTDWLEFKYDSHLGKEYKVSFYGFDMIKTHAHLSEQDARKAFDDAINEVIYQDNSVGEIEYLQNLEAQPITINLNTKTGKYELIDGYKRLLYITNKELLEYNAPVRIFTDLTDSQFLALLYSANIWKTKELFHDRGFLFALKTRFNFVIPSSAYRGGISNELDTLQLYDFGGNLTSVSKTKLMNSLLRHKFLVNDMLLMYNILPKVTSKQNYDKNMSEEIMFSIIELVGELRRAVDNNVQNDISEDLITSIFEDELIKKYCSKKHLSTRTYVINYFRDKGLYDRIKEILKNNLINKKLY